MNFFFRKILFPKFSTATVNKHLSSKENLDIGIFEAGIQRAAENSDKDLDTHFIFAGNNHHDHDDFGWTQTLLQKVMMIPKIHGNYEELETIMRNGMDKYQIKSALLTWVWMCRQDLITQELMKDYYKGKMISSEGFHKESVHDDLDSLFYRLQLGENPDGEDVLTFFLPKLTEEEHKLIEDKNFDYLETFMGGLEAGFGMNKSDSTFIFGNCSRTSYMID